jgi:hypothetical protein
MPGVFLRIASLPSALAVEIYCHRPIPLANQAVHKKYEPDEKEVQAVEQKAMTAFETYMKKIHLPLKAIEKNF